MKKLLIIAGAVSAVALLAALARRSAAPAVALVPATSAAAPAPVERGVPVQPHLDDFSSRGCTHDHHGDGEPDETAAVTTPEDPWEFPERTIDRIATELAVTRDCAIQVGRVLSDHMARTAEVEIQLGDAADASVAERLWAQAEESLGKLLTAAQIEKLKLMPLEAPPTAQREHSMRGR